MERINVTKSYLAPKEEYINIVSSIWDNHILSNFGPLNLEFEQKLKDYLKVSNLHYVTNGTLALELAIESLGDTGEIITTPFTFIATISSIVWKKFKPIFVDINPFDFNIDVTKIEEKITEKTKAIIPVHCFGFPCDVLALKNISHKYNIPLIYDAAHAFGVEVNNKSIFNYGDISISSLPATKVMHSIEGGLCIVNNLKYNEKIKSSKNFGISNSNYETIGINAKASEFHAAMGLCVLKHLDEIVSYRKYVSNLYKEYLSKEIYIPNIYDNIKYNYIYFPIVFQSEEILLEVLEELNINNIYPRRYFYPCINEIELYKDNNITPIASDISKRILCLPIDTYLTLNNIKTISFIINQIVEKKKIKQLKIN